MFAVQPNYLPRECLGVKRGTMFGATCIFGPQASFKAYPEDPAEFKPLTEDELQRIKKERRQKEAQRKQKAAENRKHLANVRVVQKNLVFVVGLSQRLAEPEVLKKHEYFGKFGKLHKVVINQSTSYAGAQVLGPSASAYVTYNRPEDALKAIQAVNNIHVDGRTIKASLGTTKYCSHFLRGTQCPKSDCMYLHELGEETASFTKEEMQQGKHQEYEQKLYEMFMNSQNLASTQNVSATAATASTTVPTKIQSRKKTSSPTGSDSPTGHSPPPQTTTKEAWPSLQPLPPNLSTSATTSSCTHPSTSSKPDRLTNGNPAPPPNHTLLHSQGTGKENAQNRAPGFHRTNGQQLPLHPDSLGSDGGKKLSSPDFSPGSSSSSSSGSGSGGSNSPNTTDVPLQTQGQSQTNFINRSGQVPPLSLSPQNHTTVPNSRDIHARLASSANGQSQSPFTSLRSGNGGGPPPGLVTAAMAAAVQRKLPFQSATDSMSLFSSSNGFPAIRNPKPLQPQLQSADDSLPIPPEIPENLLVSSSTDWQAAFGFTSNTQTETHDDDLGFDPWNESAKALAEIIEKETRPSGLSHNNNLKTNLNSVPGPHSPHSPRQNDHLGDGHRPGMPQLVSSMAQITHLLENRPKHLPPGFTSNHIGASSNNQMGPPSSKILGLMHFPSVPPSLSNPSAYSDMLNSDMNMGVKRDGLPHPQNEEQPASKDWQEGLRALLPNINISFGGRQAAAEENRRLETRSHQQPTPQHLQQQSQQQQHQLQQQIHQQQQQNSHKNWLPPASVNADPSWDPAIVTSGHIADSSHSEEPHWMASLQHLTEDSNTSNNSVNCNHGNPNHANPNHRIASLQQMSYNNTVPTWPPQSLGGVPHPPPGFHTPHVRPQVTPEAHQLEGYQ